MHLNLNKEKILLQYSGGKDSTACLVLLKLSGAEVEAIHFVHEFSYELPTQEAKRICQELEVPLSIVNIDDELKEIFLNGFRLRPCRYCKAVMDRITVDYAKEHDFKLICVGDTKDDTALVNRLSATSELTLKISKYFNRAVTLPEDIFIYRPLIDSTSSEVMDFLAENKIKIERIGDTGDKYFEYSREGCPLQFKDFGVTYSLELMHDLKKYNELCARFAKTKKIRASIHLPSEFIVTIPRGYEKTCRDFLIENGCKLSNKIEVADTVDVYHFSLQIYREVADESVIKIALARFFERLGLKIVSQRFFDKSLEIDAGKFKMFAFIEPVNLKLYGHLTSLEEISADFIKNLFSEIFHTDNILLERLPARAEVNVESLLSSVKNCRWFAQSLSSKNFIRSGAIDAITQRDLLYLKKIGVSVFVALRRSHNPELVERIRSAGIRYEKIFTDAVAYENFERSLNRQIMITSYMNFVRQSEAMCRIFELLSDAEGTALFFCKYGRDRTGIISIVLELLAGVSLAEIIADYLRNDLFSEVRKRACFDFIETFIKEYRSAEDYLLFIGVDSARISKLKFKLK